MKRQLLFMYRKYILLFTVMLLLSMGSAHGEVDAQRMVKKIFLLIFRRWETIFLKKLWTGVKKHLSGFLVSKKS